MSWFVIHHHHSTSLETCNYADDIFIFYIIPASSGASITLDGFAKHNFQYTWIPDNEQVFKCQTCFLELWWFSKFVQSRFTKFRNISTSAVSSSPDNMIHAFFCLNLETLCLPAWKIESEAQLPILAEFCSQDIFPTSPQLLYSSCQFLSESTLKLHTRLYAAWRWIILVNF